MCIKSNSTLFAWCQNWSSWDEATVIPLYSQLKGIVSVGQGISELCTKEKTTQVGIETLSRTTPGATICKGIAQFLWIPVLLRAAYKICGFCYYPKEALGKSSSALGFELYQPIKSKNRHVLVGVEYLKKENYKDAAIHFKDGIADGDTSAAIELAAIWLAECYLKCPEKDIGISPEEVKKYLEKAAETDVRAEFDYHWKLKTLDPKAFNATKQKEAMISLAKRGLEEAICHLSANISISDLREYAKKGSIENNVGRQIQFYTSLARVFECTENDKARKIVLEKAAALCTVDTIVDVVGVYEVTQYLKGDPLLAKFDALVSEDVKVATETQHAGIAYYHLARYYALNGDNVKSNKMYEKSVDLGYFKSAVEAARNYEMVKEESKAAGYYYEAAKLYKKVIDSSKRSVEYIPEISLLDEAIQWCDKAMELASDEQSEIKSKAAEIKKEFQALQTKL